MPLERAAIQSTTFNQRHLRDNTRWLLESSPRRLLRRALEQLRNTSLMCDFPLPARRASLRRYGHQASALRAAVSAPRAALIVRARSLRAAHVGPAHPSCAARRALPATQPDNPLLPGHPRSCGGRGEPGWRPSRTVPRTPAPQWACPDGRNLTARPRLAGGLSFLARSL